MDLNPAPRGAFPGPCPSKRKLCPPKRGLCPEEMNRIGATGVQLEAQIGVCHPYFRNFCELTRDFIKFLGRRPFFFGNHLFSAGKTVWISDFCQKIPQNFSEDLFFGLHLVPLIQTGINFLCPHAPLEFTQINFSSPPNFISASPVMLSWRRAWMDRNTFFSDMKWSLEKTNLIY